MQLNHHELVLLQFEVAQLVLAVNRARRVLDAPRRLFHREGLLAWVGRVNYGVVELVTTACCVAFEGLADVEIKVVLVAVLLADGSLDETVERVFRVLVVKGVVVAFIGHRLTAFSNKF